MRKRERIILSLREVSEMVTILFGHQLSDIERFEIWYRSGPELMIELKSKER